jgi:hypothetical protein
MDAVEWVQEIQREPEFKELCDALLRLEVGPLVQVYAGKGADGGIDASYVGNFADAMGRWVFQYKFIHPSTDANRARSRLVDIFIPSGKRAKDGGEFAKPGIRGACGYVLLTNVAITVPLAQKLRDAFAALHPGSKFGIWDPATLNLMLQSHPHLARSRSQAMEELCLEHVINPLWDWLVTSEARMIDWDRQENTIWPVRFSLRSDRIAVESFFDPCEVEYTGQIGYERPILQADSRLLSHAIGIAFPHALSRLSEYLIALKNLFNAVAECVKELAVALRRPQGPLSIFSQEERDRMSLGLACTLLEGAWGFPSHYPVFDNSRILAYSFYIYEGDKGKIAQTHLEEYGKSLRVQYEHGHRLPAKVLEARERLRSVSQTFADALWYPATIGMDAPRDDSEDESEPDC